MTGKRIYGVLAGILLMAVLTGCGDGTEEDSGTELMIMEPTMITMPPVAASLEEQEVFRLVYDTGNLTEEEESAVFENMKVLQQNLGLPEYMGEGIHMVSSEEWFETMAPRLYEGSRYYILKKGEETLLTVLVAYDLSGEPYSSIFTKSPEGTVTLLRREGSVIQLVRTDVSMEGWYDGNYEMWRIDSATGEIHSEQGGYKNGVIVGEYTVSDCSAQPGSAFDLWMNREGFSYKSSTVTYDENGDIMPETTPEHTLAPTRQPSAPQQPAVTPTPQTPVPAPEPEPPAPENDDDNNNVGSDNSGESDSNTGNSGTGGGSSDTGNSGTGGGSSDTGNSGTGGGSSDIGNSGTGGGNSDTDGSGSGGAKGDSGNTSGDVDIEWSDDIL